MIHVKGVIVRKFLAGITSQSLPCGHFTPLSVMAGNGQQQLIGDAVKRAVTEGPRQARMFGHH